MQEFHPSVTPCEQWGTPHKCYSCACAHHADRQGANAIALALEKEGIPCVVDQMGGFCMVVHVFGEDNKRHLGATREGVCYAENDNEDEIIEETVQNLGSEDDLRVDQIVRIVKENLWRVGRGQQ